MAYKHRDIVIAWMDGEIIQFKSYSGIWRDMVPFDLTTVRNIVQNMPWPGHEWRIKPRPVMIRHATYKNSNFVAVYLKNYNESEDSQIASAEGRADIIWLDEWHEADFSAPEGNKIFSTEIEV